MFDAHPRSAMLAFHGQKLQGQNLKALILSLGHRTHALSLPDARPRTQEAASSRR